MNTEHPERRQFLHGLATLAKGVARSHIAHPDLLLENLRKLPEHKLRIVIPTIVVGTELSYRYDQVVARTVEGRTLRLFSVYSSELQYFSRFDGQACLGDIARDIAGAEVETEPATFRRIGLFFLRLVDGRICIPANPVF